MKINKTTIVNLEILRDFYEMTKKNGNRNFDRGIKKILQQVRIVFELEELLPFEYEILKFISNDVKNIKKYFSRDGVLDKFGDNITVEYRESVKKQEAILSSIQEKTNLELFSAYLPMNSIEYSVTAVFTSAEILSLFGSDLFTICEYINDKDKFEMSIANYFFNTFYKLVYQNFSYNTITHITSISEDSEDFLNKKIFSLIDNDTDIMLYSIFGDSGKFKFINSDSSDDQNKISEIVNDNSSKVSFLLNAPYLIYFALHDYIVMSEPKFVTMLANRYFTQIPDEIKQFEIRINEVMNELNNELVYSVNNKETYDPIICSSYITMNMKTKFMIEMDINELIDYKNSYLYNSLVMLGIDMKTDLFVKDIIKTIENVATVISNNVFNKK